jgi:hypothetical protein
MSGEATQKERLVEFLRSHPGATSLEITLACRIVNVTGRVSDARADGLDIRCERRSDGEQGYTVYEPEGQIGMGLS